MKAMVLAAGRGTRLQPLTASIPKPLISVGDTTLLGHVLSQLKKAGITDVVINVHHLGDQIQAAVGDGAMFGLRVQYSVETELLETGGGIYQALPLLGDAPFLVLSGDVWTNYPLRQLTEKKVSGAHLVFVDNPDFHQQGDYGLTDDGVVQLNASKKYTYANLGVLHPDLFQDFSAGVFRLSAVFEKAIARGFVTGERFNGVWHNVGTPHELEALRKNAG